MTKEYPNIQRDLFMNLRWWTDWLQSNIYMQMQVFVSSWLHCGCCYCCCLARLQYAWIASPRDTRGGVDTSALIRCCGGQLKRLPVFKGTFLSPWLGLPLKQKAVHSFLLCSSHQKSWRETKETERHNLDPLLLIQLPAESVRNFYWLI